MRVCIIFYVPFKELACTDCPSRSGSGRTVPASLKSVEFNDGKLWVTAVTLSEAFEAIARFQQEGLSFRIVGGNTGTGIFLSNYYSFK